MVFCATLLVAPLVMTGPKTEDDKDQDDTNRIENSGKVLGEIFDSSESVPEDLLNKTRGVGFAGGRESGLHCGWKLRKRSDGLPDGQGYPGTMGCSGDEWRCKAGASDWGGSY